MAKQNITSIVVNVLIKKENDTWLGHCLELDIVVTAATKGQVKKDMRDLIAAQIDYAFSHNNLNHLFRPAPAEVWEEFYKCKEATEEKIKLGSEFQKDRDLKTFVPPWIIAKTCLSKSACVVP